MSHYAKIVHPLSGWILGLPAVLNTGTEIKNVKLTPDGGGYACAARLSVDPEVGIEWIRFVTQGDLPAFTDKGRAGRERNASATMQRGRPSKVRKLSTTTGIRMRPDQLQALKDGCAKADVSRNEAILGALVAAGLVPR